MTERNPMDDAAYDSVCDYGASHQIFHDTEQQRDDLKRALKSERALVREMRAAFQEINNLGVRHAPGGLGKAQRIARRMLARCIEPGEKA